MNALPHSPYRRSQIEWQEEAQDDRTDVQKLHDACRLVVEARERREEERARSERLGVVGSKSYNAAVRADNLAFADLCWLLENQFGDEVDVELLAKALAS